MAIYETGKPIICPHCGQEVIMQEMPEGYATERWNGNRGEVPYLRCELCTATFPRWGVDEYLADL